MAYLTQAQLAAYAAAAGAPNPALAAAIAMAETDGTGNTNAHNPLPPDDSYGPWQINMIGSEGPARRKALGITSNTQLYDPAVNARAMMLVSNGGTNFTPWSTYTSGKYERYLTAEQAGVGGDLWNGLKGTVDPLGPLLGPLDPFNLLPGGGNSLSGTVQGLGDAVGWIGKAGSWLSKASNWLRIGYVVGGGALVIVGLGMVAKDAELAAAAGTVQKVAKKAGVVGGKVGAAGRKVVGKK